MFWPIQYLNLVKYLIKKKKGNFFWLVVKEGYKNFLFFLLAYKNFFTLQELGDPNQTDIVPQLGFDKKGSDEKRKYFNVVGKQPQFFFLIFSCPPPFFFSSFSFTSR